MEVLALHRSPDGLSTVTGENGELGPYVGVGNIFFCSFYILCIIGSKIIGEHENMGDVGSLRKEEML